MFLFSQVIVGYLDENASNTTWVYPANIVSKGIHKDISDETNQQHIKGNYKFYF